MEKYHRHVHSEEERKAVCNRLARAIGHLSSVKGMVERDMDCCDILIQIAAVRAALTNTGKYILKSHIQTCIAEAIEHHDQQQMDELLKTIDLFQ